MFEFKDPGQWLFDANEKSGRPNQQHRSGKGSLALADEIDPMQSLAGWLAGEPEATATGRRLGVSTRSGVGATSRSGNQWQR
jgi:hypothetical protein